MGMMRRVYAAGDDQIWYSTDGGNAWVKDAADVIPQMGVFVDPLTGQRSKQGTVGSFPDDCCTNSAQVIAVEPGHPDHLYVAVRNISHGPAYYFPDAPPGASCEQIAARCGGAVVWLGDYSQFSQGQSGSWVQLASPPTYAGVSTPSGRVYIATQKTETGYLLFLSDTSHVHVSDGRPEHSAAWHRLDGRDASQSKRENDLSNELFLHVDPHAIAISPNFNIKLKSTDTPSPYDQNSELDAYLGGTLWMANDGGVYRSAEFDSAHDRMKWELGSGLSTLQLQGPFAGVAVASNAPALYFGVPDNDDFFSLDGGATWQNNPVIDCGDCLPWFADPAQPNRVLEFDRPPPFGTGGWWLYTNPQQNGYPNPGERYKSVPPPPGGLIGNYFTGYRPIILTLDGEEPLSDGDYVLIRQKPDGSRVLLRTTQASSIMTATDWVTMAIEQGPTLPTSVDVVQASGGHSSTVFYVGDPSGSGGLWKWKQGMANWQQIVPAPNGSASVARRFFVDPYNPNVIYVIDTNAIKRSDNGGLTWRVDASLDRVATEDGTFSYDLISLPITLGEGAVITDMIFDRREPGTHFAVGNAGVFFTANGTNWGRLLSTTAWPGHPVAAYFDSISRVPERALYVGFNGRGILRFAVPETCVDPATCTR
jgi:hypothetical protein